MSPTVVPVAATLGGRRVRGSSSRQLARPRGARRAVGLEPQCHLQNVRFDGRQVSPAGPALLMPGVSLTQLGAISPQGHVLPPLAGSERRWGSGFGPGTSRGWQGPSCNRCPWSCCKCFKHPTSISEPLNNRVVYPSTKSTAGCQSLEACVMDLSGDRTEGPRTAWEVESKAGLPCVPQSEFGHQRAQDVTHGQRVAVNMLRWPVSQFLATALLPWMSIGTRHILPSRECPAPSYQGQANFKRNNKNFLCVCV